MKKKSLIFYVLLFMLTVRFLTVEAADSTQIDFKQYFESKEGFSGNVFIAQNGKHIFSESFGYANLEQGSKVNASTKFRIGSITKVFTALGVMVLVEKEKLHLEDSISLYLKEIPLSWEGITVCHLLSHTAGLLHSWESDSFKKRSKEVLSMDEVLNLFYNSPLLSPPGEKYHYSGVGYFVLARIIEVVSGKTYDEFIKEKILMPAKMYHTGFDNPFEIIDNRALGYESKHGVIINSPYLYMPLLKGGGNMYSTANDLILFDKALRENIIISEKSKKLVFALRKKTAKKPTKKKQLKQEAGKIKQYRGSINGFFAQVVRFLDDDVVIVILTNQRYLDNPDIAKGFIELVKNYMLIK